MGKVSYGDTHQVTHKKIYTNFFFFFVNYTNFSKGTEVSLQNYCVLFKAALFDPTASENLS